MHPLIKPIHVGRYPLLTDNAVHQVHFGLPQPTKVLLHCDPDTADLWVGVEELGIGRFAHGQKIHGIGELRQAFTTSAPILARIKDFINSQLDIRWETWMPTGGYECEPPHPWIHPTRIGSEASLADAGWIYQVMGFRKPDEGLGLEVMLKNVDNNQTRWEQLDSLVPPKHPEAVPALQVDVE